MNSRYVKTKLNTSFRLYDYYCYLQVNRPLAMKKDGIQTRKRKPKSVANKKTPSKSDSSGKSIWIKIVILILIGFTIHMYRYLES